MKRTVAALALSVSTPSFALMMPPTATKIICLDTYETETGTLHAGNCDQAANNVTLKATLLDNGCAAGQVALVAVAYPVYTNNAKQAPTSKFDIEINSCLPPNVAQL